MLRTLNIDTRVPTIHGVVIRRQAVDEQLRAYITVDAARRYARKTVKSALAQVEAIENLAMQEGFQAGWRRSLDAVAQALQDSDALFQKIESGLKERVKDTLTKTMNQPELVLHLIRDWLSAGPPQSGKLRVIVPQRAVGQIDAIKSLLLERTGVLPVVSVGSAESVVIQYQDQGVEFSPARTAGEINESIAQCFQRLAVRQQCQAWSDEVTRQWIADLAAGKDADAVPARATVDPCPVSAEPDRHRSIDAGLPDALSFEQQMDDELFGEFSDDFACEQE